MINKLLTITTVIVFSFAISVNGQNLILNALDFDTKEIPGFVSFYKDQARNALAVNAELYPNQWAATETIFTGASGRYDIIIVTLTEFDGEPTYRVRVQGKLIGDYQHPYTGIDFEEARAIWKGIELKKGDIVRIEANNVSNGLIPEGDHYAFARGRWTQLIISRSKK
jgi:hypothetical protein